MSMQVNDQQRIKEYYAALLRRDERFTGIFYVGVRTTGVFCIATCRARKPKLENVEFFTQVKAALQHGYRPCKICKPTENADEPGPVIRAALDLLKTQPDSRVSDGMLRQNGLAPEKIRRWFKHHYGLTFQAYQRMIRINSAYLNLKNGSSVTRSAFASGYESLSGFGYAFKSVTGKAPASGRDKTTLIIDRLTTPLGPMFTCATDQGICLLEFSDRRMLETEFTDLQRRLNGVILVGENLHISQLKMEMDQYFAGERQLFEVKLHAPGSPFQQSVWDLLLQIPYGETRSYRQIAEYLGRPEAVRAVASANGHNRIAILIPCHRVIGKNGHLTGYGGGLERKQWLLDHERRHCAGASD